MARLATRKTDLEWSWEHSQMLRLGYEGWQNENTRAFFKKGEQLVRFKNAGKYLNNLGRFYDGPSELEECPDAGTSLL